MTSQWRDMTLSQVYPYWILGEVPDADFPYIACNDMLAGNMADEIVAVAGLTQHDLAELGELLPRAFARLGLPPMSRDDAAKLLAMEKMRAIAQQLVLEKEDPLRGANAIYWRAMEAGAFGDDDDVDPRVAKYGVEFLQLSDTLEERQRDPANKHQFEQLIIEAAATLLAGEPVPEWYLENGELCRGRPPWAAPPETTR